MEDQTVKLPPLEKRGSQYGFPTSTGVIILPTQTMHHWGKGQRFPTLTLENKDGQSEKMAWKSSQPNKEAGF